MKFFLIAMVLVAYGCAGGQPKGVGDPGDVGAEEMAPGSEAIEKEGDTVGSDTGQSKPVVVEGTWENGSCGARKYNRSVTFEEGGEFVAVDQVAPCPEDAECVWSGIIEWKGTWSLQDQIISIEPGISENERMPERLPEAFVILNEQPLSVGEKEGSLICPYTRAQ